MLSSKSYSSSVLKPEGGDKKVKTLIESLTQAVTSSSLSTGSFSGSNTNVMINIDGTKWYVDNHNSETVVDYLNQLSRTSPALDISDLKNVKLPQIRDFKYKTCNFD